MYFKFINESSISHAMRRTSFLAWWELAFCSLQNQKSKTLIQSNTIILTENKFVCRRAALKDRLKEFHLPSEVGNAQFWITVHDLHASEFNILRNGRFGSENRNNITPCFKLSQSMLLIHVVCPKAHWGFDLQNWLSYAKLRRIYEFSITFHQCKSELRNTYY